MVLSNNDLLTAIDIVALTTIWAGAVWSAFTLAISHGLRGGPLLSAVARACPTPVPTQLKARRTAASVETYFPAE